MIWNLIKCCDYSYHLGGIFWHASTCRIFRRMFFGNAGNWCECYSNEVGACVSSLLAKFGRNLCISSTATWLVISIWSSSLLLFWFFFFDFRVSLWIFFKWSRRPKALVKGRSQIWHTNLTWVDAWLRVCTVKLFFRVNCFPHVTQPNFF